MHRDLLLRTFRKLQGLPRDGSGCHNEKAYRQECLDFLAMVAGMKAAFMTGRGFDDPEWIMGAIGVARKMGLRVRVGSMWRAKPIRADLPDWFAEFAEGARGGDAVFICTERETAEALNWALQRGRVTIAGEAHLLGYPKCCVTAEYRRDEYLDRAYHMILERTANGDEAQIRRLIDEGAQLYPKTPEEEALLEKASQINVAPYTSINMCESCLLDPNSPARRLSERYEQLAYFIDRPFADRFAYARLE